MHEAKSQLSALAEKVWQGETVIIAKAGKPYLDLLPHREGRIQRRPGRFKEEIVIAADFDRTPEEVINAFEGEE
ncbi:MAG: type II toxin-antitoxin system prevent-host-death family antitoxin [Desulfuromonas sp.]|nr:MAG: type II toxin-antitoxin system prevent-host-death family antitoxin [Desulfuromonas sp.]